MAKEAAQAAQAAQKHPYVRVTAPSVDYAVECAGKAWAGVSEVPRDSISARQLEQLKADERLRVEEFDRPHVA